MASKRMFDRAIIDTDRFMDLSMSSKALYFLLGMEADDEGFVSYKKVMRIHGGNEDDIKVLLAKEFLIGFPSGVVVITDWNTNNWLDTRRIRPTEYQKEKESLLLTDNNKYVLSKCLASIEESSIEEKRREERFSEENDLDSSPEINDYLGVPLPEDWSDDSFVDSDGTYIPRFTDNFGRSVKQSEITALRNKAKAKPRVKEKPVKQSFNYEEELAKLRDSFHKTNKIVALIWFHKRYKFENALQMQAQFDMDKTYGAKLKGYSGEQISKAIELCKQDAEELGYDWKASTVLKKITEIL